MVNNAHGFLVGLIVTWFNQRVDECGVWAVTEAHTQSRPNNFRLPNISVLGIGPLEQIQRSAPLIVIEVLSPCNTMSEMLSKLEDYEDLSIRNIWIIDPVTRAGLVCRKKEMKRADHFLVESTPIYLDLQEVFATFDRFQALR